MLRTQKIGGTKMKTLFAAIAALTLIFTQAQAQANTGKSAITDNNTDAKTQAQRYNGQWSGDCLTASFDATNYPVVKVSLNGDLEEANLEIDKIKMIEQYDDILVYALLSQVYPKQEFEIALGVANTNSDSGLSYTDVRLSFQLNDDPTSRAMKTIIKWYEYRDGKVVGKEKEECELTKLDTYR